MKLYSELSAIESEIIKLDGLSKTLSVIAEGAEHADPEHVKSALFFIHEQLQYMNDNLRYAFDRAWDADRLDLNVEPDEE
jgi:hypothetical protein